MESNPLERPGQIDKVLRVPEQPDVTLRRLGPRSLTEVPPDEVAVVFALRRDEQGLAGDAAKRRVLGIYGLKRLTADPDAHLTACLALLAEVLASPGSGLRARRHAAAGRRLVARPQARYHSVANPR